MARPAKGIAKVFGMLSLAIWGIRQQYQDLGSRILDWVILPDCEPLYLPKQIALVIDWLLLAKL